MYGHIQQHEVLSKLCTIIASAPVQPCIHRPFGRNCRGTEPCIMHRLSSV